MVMMWASSGWCVIVARRAPAESPTFIAACVVKRFVPTSSVGYLLLLLVFLCVCVCVHVEALALKVFYVHAFRMCCWVCGQVRRNVLYVCATCPRNTLSISLTVYVRPERTPEKPLCIDVYSVRILVLAVIMLHDGMCIKKMYALTLLCCRRRRRHRRRRMERDIIHKYLYDFAAFGWKRLHIL